MKSLQIVICILVFKTTLCAVSEPSVAQESQRASPEQFPWQAALFFERSSRFWFCSGSIVSSKWILTAAHCVNDAESVLVYAGTVDVSQEIEPTSISEDFIVHEEFKSDSFDNDVALIKLPKLLKFDDKTHMIPLSSDKTEAGATLIVSGWSETNINGTKVNPYLTYRNVEISNVDECQKRLNQDVSSSHIICTITELVSGDDGGPVVINSDVGPNLVALVTLVSHTRDESDSLVAYTRIEPYLDWIKEKTTAET